MIAGVGDLFLGLMSGTSMDAVDAVLADFRAPFPQILGGVSLPIPADLRQAIVDLCQPGNDGVDRLGGVDCKLGELFAAAALAVLAASHTSATQVRAIGSHGQTIRHRPPGTVENPFTLQIGDPNRIASITGITTVADFRRRDLAEGGQGAPLVPAFHRDVFRHADLDRAVVNIGGIANITWLPASGDVLGFDTGPGNVLMDGWHQKHRGAPFDHQGRWASGATVDKELLARLESHPYFARCYPKTTGREDFHLSYLEDALKCCGREIEPQQIQATLLALTAHTIAAGIGSLPQPPDQIYLCGGGAYNTALVAALADLLRPAQVATTSALGVEPRWVEATAFAWLARQTLRGLSGNLPTVTGARKQTVLGGIYPA